MILPVATAEDGGPVHIFRRSWDLTAGHYWRLLGFLALVGLVAIVVLLTAQITGGLLAEAAFGEAKPLTVSALIVALITGVVQTALVVIVATMTARIYVQLAGRKRGT
jgi:membrane-anchored glycerophosphoryl diester phosphodiesterase (GDPDase)